MINDRYAAGLWANRIDRQLALSRITRGFFESNADSPTEYQAPSWSWAPVNGGVTFQNTMGHMTNIWEFKF